MKVLLNILCKIWAPSCPYLLKKDVFSERFIKLSHVPYADFRGKVPQKKKPD